MTDIDASNARVVYDVRSPARRIADANAAIIRQAATDALVTNKAFSASTPTAAQTTAQVKALSRQQNGIIRLLLSALDAAD